MGKKYLKTEKKIFTATMAAILAGVFAISTFAVVLFHSFVTGKSDISSGNIENINMTITGMTSGQTASSDITAFILKKAGDKVTFSVTVSNNTDYNLVHSGTLALKSITQAGNEIGFDDDKYNLIKSCILVYCDGKFVDSLAHITQSGVYEFINDTVLPSNKTDKHEITFELHASATQYADIGFNLYITDYAQNADSKRYIFVKNENEFEKAVDDINSGLLIDDNGIAVKPEVVLADDVTLTKKYTLINPFYIDLYGNNLVGGTVKFSADALIRSSVSFSSIPTSTTSIILNSEAAVLDISDFYTSDGKTNVALAYAKNVTISLFSPTKVLALVTERAKKNLSCGIASGAYVDILTSLSFYISSECLDISVAGNNCELSSSVITSVKRSATDVAVLTLNVVGAGDTAEIEFKQYGNDEETVLENIKNEALAHIEALVNADDTIMSDIFLPSEIKQYGASIEWISANPDIISIDGRIIDDSADREIVTLYANIRINEKVYQLSYSFVVSGVNNEVRFSNFIAHLSPLKLKEVWRGNTDTSSEDFIKSHQFLPIVNTGSGYHYLKKFTSPDGNLTDAKLVWEGYEDIGLEYLLYSQDATYNYISVYTNESGEQSVYLNTPVFNTFAQINLSAKFVGDDKTYTGAVNIIIEPGNYEELLDEVFQFIQGQFDATDIYKNVVKTRMADGMRYEKGDFYIDAKYVISSSSQSNKYSITLDSGVSGGILTATKDQNEKGYNVSVDLTKATQVESRVPMTVTVKYTYVPEVTATRTLYVTVPAVILPDENGFSNYSVFSSVKYQLFGYLPVEERKNGNDAFTVSGNKITNNTKAYILLKDIERCNGVGGSWFDGVYAGENLTVNYGKKLDSLYFLVGKANLDNLTERKVYGLLTFIQWATGTESGKKTLSIDGTDYTMTSDGKKYLTPDEINVLKSYYCAVTDITDSEWQTLFDSVSSYPVANGTRSRVISDSKKFGEAIKNLTTDSTIYFKYTELMRWALNEQNFPKSAFFSDSYPIGNPPNGGSLSWGRYTVANGTQYNIQKNSGNSSLYNGYYNEDDTEYISEREEVVLQAFWNNVNALSGFKNAFASYTVTPTYLEQNAVQLLVRNMYEALGIENFSESFVSCDGKNIPAVTSVDGALEGITYFKNLIKLVIKGTYSQNGNIITAELPAFLHTDFLGTFYNRLTSSDTAAKLTSLVMYNCAQDYVTFELDGISAFGSLTYLDLGMNYGIKSLGSALDITAFNTLEYLDLSGADSDEKYSVYPLSVLSNRISEVYYTPDGTSERGKSAEKVRYAIKEMSELLAYLRELEKIDGQYVQLQQGIKIGNKTTSLYWQISDGNPIYNAPVTKAGVFTPGTYGSHNTVDEMIGELTNYYYGYDNTLYRVSYNATNGQLELIDSGISVREQTGLTDTDKAELEKSLMESIDYDIAITKGSETEWLLGGSEIVQQRTSEWNNYVTYYISIDGQTPLSTTGYYYIYKRYATKNVTYNFTYKGTNAATKIFKAYLADSKSVIEYTYSYGKSGEITGKVTLSIGTYLYYGNDSGTANTDDKAFDLGSASKIYWGTRRQWWSYSFNSSENITYSYNLDGTYAGNSFSSSLTNSNEDTIKSAILNEWETTLQADVKEKINASTEYKESLKNQTMITLSVPHFSNETEKSAALTRLNNIYNGVQNDSVYLYTGTTGNGAYIKDSVNTTYNFARNRFYRLVWDGSALVFEDTYVNAANATDTTVTMESILALANADANNVKRGNWLGLYVWYSGTGEGNNDLTVNGRAYEKGYVYRIIWANDNHSEFTYKKYRTCTSVNGNDFAAQPLKAADGTASEGDIYYLTNATNFYAANKFYVMTYDDVGGFYYLNRFGDVIPLLDLDKSGTSANKGYLRIKNDKLYITTNVDYSGTGGTKYVDIVAVVRDEDGKEHERTFRVEVIG
ncbi:MAG: hypothetical protein MR471_07410 [Clostridia bacterium]|nr:hypothetical protein [Clostridia bacterium]